MMVLLSSARATTKGLSQIVTPELQAAGEAALEELLPARVLRALPDDAESRTFAARVIGKSAQQIDRRVAEG